MAGLAGLITKVDHVGIAVEDLDVAIEFYKSVVGFELQHREENVEQGVVEAMMAIGGSQTQIQLLAPLTPGSAIAKFISNKGVGVQQVAYTVTSLDQAMQVCKELGIRMLFSEPKRGTKGSRINFAHPKDCGGVLVELVEH